MSVTFINKKNFILSNYCTNTSEDDLQKLILSKEDVINQNLLKLNTENSNLYSDNSLDSNSIETNQKTPEKHHNRKRSHSSSSSENSSFSSSPEIKFSPPVQYMLSTKNNTTIIIKKTMSRKLDKCNDEEIANILDSDDEKTLFDNDTKTKNNNEASPIKLKFRRSTNTSDYKLINDDGYKRRASLRASVTVPIRYRQEDSKSNLRKSPNTIKGRTDEDRNDHCIHTRRKTRQLKQKQEKRFVSDDDDGDDDNDDSSKAYVPSKHNILNSIATTPSRRTLRRNARVISIGSDKKEDESDETNKENDLDDSYHSDKSENIIKSTRRKNEDEQDMTPRKQDSSITNVQTPRRITRKMLQVDKSNGTIAHGTPKKMPQIEEPGTPNQKNTTVRIQTPSVKIGSLTPSMRPRKAIVEKPKTIYETARAQLHVSAVPKSLPCREKEFNDIFMFLERKLGDESGGCMYISGVPGTGKTATVNEVIRCLKKLVEKKTIADFNFIGINGMKLSEPRQAYVQILKQLTGETANWETARWTIEKKLTNSKDQIPMTLLLIDELDVLCNKRQDVVYNLLDWPSKPRAKLVVITIANTMDLPERVLMSRVTSRLGLTRLTFQPYDHKQLQEIVLTRLKEFDAFKSDAVQLVARKVAAVSGDARRALDICRRATEIAESDQSNIVSIQHVNDALTEMIANAKVRAIMHCSEMEKVFLQSVYAETQRTGVEETIFTNVYKQVVALCSLEGVKPPNITETLDISARLNANRLILYDDARKDIQQRIFLNVSSDDIYFALNKNI